MLTLLPRAIPLMQSNMAASDAQLDDEMSVLADDKVMALTEADVHNVRGGG